MKKYSVIFSPYALDELDDASAAVKFDDTRCTSLKKFPYSLFYTIDEITTTVIITNIFFAKRKPFWKT